MINGLGVLGWGVGGIEAEAAMLGQPISMLIPQVVGFRLTGELPEGATATDLVLTVTQMLRERGVVGKFVEFYGEGLAQPAARRPRDDREHVARDRRDLRDLPGRRGDAPLPRVHRPAEGARRRSSRRTARSRGSSTTRARRRPPTRTRSSSTSATWSRRSPGPKRPQDRVALSDAADRLPRGARGVHAATTRTTGYDEALAESLPVERPAAPTTAAAEEPKVGPQPPDSPARRWPSARRASATAPS